MSDPGRVAAARALRSRLALWTAFAAVHAWWGLVGVVLMPMRAFWDVDLYRYWSALALDTGRWPVLHDAWVYPAGALVPVVAPALTGARSTAGYAVGWCVLVTVLDAVAVAVLLRRSRPAPSPAAGGPAQDGASRGAPPVGAWWWLAFLLALGPVGMGRLDAVVAPLCVVALAVAMHHPARAAALLTAGAWVKVAPGALLLPLAAVARRPVRDVVVPAAAVCAVVVGVVGAAGGLARIAGFVTEQGRRGLQVEAVAATPWVVAGLVDERVRITFDDRLSTWEVTGPGTAVAAAVLGVALPAAVAGLALRLRHVRRGAGPDEAGPALRDVLLWGALAASALLLVLNKVGSPQLVGWLAAPVVVALTPARTGTGTGAAPGLPGRAAGWAPVAAGVLVLAALTQVVFPLGAAGVVGGDAAVTTVLAVRNVGLVVLLVVAVRRIGPRRPAGTPVTPPTAPAGRRLTPPAA